MIERLAHAQDEIERVIVVDGAQVGKRNAFLRPVGAQASDHPRRPAAGEPGRAVPRAGGGPGGGAFHVRRVGVASVLSSSISSMSSGAPLPGCNRGGRLRSGDARRPHRGARAEHGGRFRRGSGAQLKCHGHDKLLPAVGDDGHTRLQIVAVEREGDVPDLQWNAGVDPAQDRRLGLEPGLIAHRVSEDGPLLLGAGVSAPRRGRPDRRTAPATAFPARPWAAA